MQDYPKHVCELKTGEESEVGKFSRNWRRIIKMRLQNMFLISNRNFRSYLFLRTKGAIQKEILRQKNSKYWYVVHPFSMLRLYWEIFMLCIYFVQTLFLAFSTTYLNSFVATYYVQTGRSLKNIFIGIHVDFALSMISLADMFGFFITGYYDLERRLTVMTPNEIFKHYFFPGFILDLSSSLPVDSLITYIGGMSAYTSLSQPEFIFLQLYNIYRLVRFRRFLSYTLQYTNLNIFSMSLFRMVLAFFIFVLLVHWTGALGLVIPQMIGGKALYDDKVNNSWIQASNFLKLSLTQQYVTVLMTALQNNLGANESVEGFFTSHEFLIAIFSNLVGRIFFIVFLITFLEAVTAGSALKVKLRIILDELQVYMKNKDLPMHLKKRLSRFYLYRFQAHYFSNRAMLGRLTESLRKEISMYTCHRLLQNTEVFQSVPNKILARFVQRMNREIYFPKDVIIQGNTFGECMYFICSGAVAVETLNEKEICRLGDGDFFGEVALIVPDRRRIATVKALTITEVYRLEYSDYKTIIELYPDVYNRLENFALDRYKTTVLLEERRDSRNRNELR